MLVSLGFVRDISLYVTWRHAAGILCLTGGLLSPDFQAKPEDPAERGHPERFDLRISRSDLLKFLLNTSCSFCCQSRNPGSMYTCHLSYLVLIYVACPLISNERTRLSMTQSIHVHRWNWKCCIYRRRSTARVSAEDTRAESGARVISRCIRGKSAGKAHVVYVYLLFSDSKGHYIMKIVHVSNLMVVVAQFLRS